MEVSRKELGVVEEFASEFQAAWDQVPYKAMFFGLLGAWAVLFQFAGNSTFGYYNTHSLFAWLINAYNDPFEITDDAHGNVVPFVVLFLFYLNRKSLAALPLRQSWIGVPILVAAMALHIVGYRVQQPRLSVLAFILGVYGLMGLAWGPRFLRASAPLYALTIFAVPFGSLAEVFTFPLRLLVTKVVALVCNGVLSLDLVREGTTLLDPSRTYAYDVAPACSGMRSLMATIFLSVVFGYIAFTKPWQRLVMLASAVPLAFAGNVLRMLVIVLVTEVAGREIGNQVHDSALFSVLPYVPVFAGLLFEEHLLKNLAQRFARPPGGAPA